LFKLFIRAALWLFCSNISIKNKYLLNTKGPLLIIANHPNSFLDAIIIGAQYKKRVYFLARGDVFTKWYHRFLLGLLNMIPIYRIREGKQFLHLNEYAFNKSVEMLGKGYVVLIFIEGICINAHELQPFKKGATRILEIAQKKGLYPNIHIVGIAYNQMKGIGKKILLNLSELKNIKTIQTPKDRVEFNNNAFDILNKTIQIPTTPTYFNKNILYYFHLPYYNYIKNIVAKKTKGTVFFDSVLFSVLLFTYPVFLSILFFLLYLIKTPLPIIFLILFSIVLLNKKCLE
jgi:1-acyl-sn-glycerol-3-phosphate acyltransferase